MKNIISLLALLTLGSIAFAGGLGGSQSTVGTVPSGAAGGDLTGTYPNPSIGSIAAGSSAVFSSTFTGQFIVLAGNPAAAQGTLIAKSTSSTAGTPVLNIQDNTGSPAFQVLNSSTVVNFGADRLASRTMIQLSLIAPGAVGERYYCSTCSPAKEVVSTGTAAGNFADAVGATFK